MPKEVSRPDWGGWVLKWDGYAVLEFDGYQVSVEAVSDAEWFLNFLQHVRRQPWSSPEVVAGLVAAAGDLFAPPGPASVWQWKKVDGKGASDAAHNVGLVTDWYAG